MSEELVPGSQFKSLIEQDMQDSYLRYSMSVIVARALPDARDGFKPVHRRVMFSMHKLGVVPNKSTVKSARIVGDVIGKYHPHGDSAVYETLVRMAQDFSLRYPLVFGQGNFGNIDGDGAAAMRYTEAKMNNVGALMLEDLEKDTVASHSAASHSATFGAAEHAGERYYGYRCGYGDLDGSAQPARNCRRHPCGGRKS